MRSSALNPAHITVNPKICTDLFEINGGREEEINKESPITRKFPFLYSIEKKGAYLQANRLVFDQKN